MGFITSLLKEHAKLRRTYYGELVLFLSLLLLSLLTLLMLETFSITNFFAVKLNILWAALAFSAFTILGFVYFPLRAKRLQKRLISRLFVRLKEQGINIIPNPQGGQDYNYATLLAENGMNINIQPNVITKYEYAGRLVHALHYKDGKKPFVIIHIPAVECPYYLQINNGNFAVVDSYLDDAVSKVSFVSPHKLTYYATKGPSEVKVYLRTRLETKFNELLNVRPFVYQYVKTYSDEFLLIRDLKLDNKVVLTNRYDADYFKKMVEELQNLQKIMNIMLEKGR